MLLVDGLLNGLILGGIYAFTVLGVAFIYGISGIPQFAVGSVGVFSGFLVWFLEPKIGTTLAILTVLLVCFIMGFLLQALLLNPIRRRGGDFNTFFLITFSIAIILTGVTLRFFPQSRISIYIPTIYFTIAGLWLDVLKILGILSAIVILLFIYVLTEYTDTGKCWKATSQNPELAELLGVNTDLVFSIISGIGFVFGAFTGILWGALYNLTPEEGYSLTFTGFIIAVVGGIGNIWGGFISALLMGIVISFAGLLIGGMWQFVILYLVFVIMLLLFPQGVLRSERSI
jgi:branched-chain amino acid transport system permease protein